jgi:hypothetical protein
LDQQRSYLRSALQQDRRPLSIFLGAGAPMAVKVEGEPIIPDVVGLTASVQLALTGVAAKTLNTVIETLKAAGIETPTLEDILDYLRSLSAILGSEPIRGINPEDVVTTDREICECVRRMLGVRLPSTRTPFHAVSLWTNAVQRHAPIELFTTNYDLLMEEALEDRGVPYFDGFVGSHRPLFDLEAVEEDCLPVRWVRLWKLHGSINWEFNPSHQVIRTSGPAHDGSTLIYPSHLKYAQSRRLPYLALLDRLRAFLRQPSAVLVTTGFGFRDEHINEVVLQALRSNPTAAVIALMYGRLEEYPECAELALQASNLSLICRDQAVIGTHQDAWSGAGGGESDLGDFSALGDLLWDLVGASVEARMPAAGTPEAKEE